MEDCLQEVVARIEPSQVGISEGGVIMPFKPFVEAYANTVDLRDGYGDLSREEGVSDRHYVFYQLGYDFSHFGFPTNLLGSCRVDDRKNVVERENFFETVAALVVQRAHDAIVSSAEFNRATKPLSLIDCDPGGEYTRLATVRWKIEDVIRHEVARILHDGAVMDEILAVVEQEKGKVFGVVAANYIDNLDEIRREAEKGVPKWGILVLLQKALREVLHIDDLDVEFLSSEDIVRYGCEGRYIPAKGEKRARVCIPVTVFNSNYSYLYKDSEFEEEFSVRILIDRFVNLVAYHCVATTVVRKIMLGDSGYEDIDEGRRDKAFAVMTVLDKDWRYGVEADSLEAAAAKVVDEIRDSIRIADVKKISEQIKDMLWHSSVWEKLLNIERLRNGWYVDPISRREVIIERKPDMEVVVVPVETAA